MNLFAKLGRHGEHPSIAERIDATGDCWEWTGMHTVGGYGSVTKNGKPYGVHRIVWEALVGDIPNGLEMDHLCRNHGCCNPDHLEPVTHAENIRRGISNNGNRTKTQCPKGHPYDIANTYIHKGKRRCRTCNAEAGRRYRRRLYR